MVGDSGTYEARQDDQVQAFACTDEALVIVAKALPYQTLKTVSANS